MLDSLFHPAVADWFGRSFPGPTEVQARAWPAIRAGRPVLIAAPTGSGKTLAAFLAAIDGLVRQGLARELPDETRLVYVSPLKALSNDIRANLEAPLAGIAAALSRLGLPEVEIRTAVRTGDSSQSDRARMRRLAPHILVTTPESLYVLLGSESGRQTLATTRTVIVDEVHAVAPNKRGAHLALSLERLAALCPVPPQRIGLSATQKPVELVAHFLAGAGPFPEIVDAGHQRARDLALEVPSSPLEAVMASEVWTQIYDRLAELIAAHRTTLVFVNTRRMAERVTRHLSERLEPGTIAAHHGSLAKEARLEAEQRLKRGELRAMVATASLELGIDIGEVDLVCQLGATRSISSFLQRVGRSGHAVSGTPKGRLFPLSRDELVEGVALLDSVARGELDRLTIPENPLDVLAQQVVAESAAQEWRDGELFALVRRAWPYRDLPRADFDAVLAMLADGFSTRNGRRGALIHHDGVNHLLRARRGARMTALTSGGTIPDNADYQVLLEPESHIIGTVNEDFAVESLTGDVFQLGNASYRIMRVERGTVRVEDARGQPPNIPFWLGEAPGRSDELSEAVSRLRANVAARLPADPSGEEIRHWLQHDLRVDEPSARQVADYLAAGWGALGCLPTRERIVFERFFDESGGMQLVIHSPYGSRINRAWGLSLRKRFCRKFNFELQAAATEDNIVLSLTSVHSFDLAEVARYLHPASVRALLVQALLDAPMFNTRWRWVAAVALALPRFRGGRKVPPQLARMQAEDLIAATFPDQIACAENLEGEREIPDHPLVRQTLADCLGEAMDVDGLERLLERLMSGAIEVVARDLTEPSPLALEVLSARPYAYLDDAPLEERRTQAVMARRWLAPAAAAELGRLDREAIDRLRAEAWPEAESADELHDALVWLSFLDAGEAGGDPRWPGWLAALAGDGRVARLTLPGGERLWVAAERARDFGAAFPAARLDPAPELTGQMPSTEAALVEILRGRLEGLGPVTASALAAPLGLAAEGIAAALAAIEGEGFALRGHFTPGGNEEEWCERRLLARIHRYTVKRLRAEIEPVSARDFLRFLFAWQHVTPETRMEGASALDAVVAQLEGFEAPASAWEGDLLAARIAGYAPGWLDERCLAGHLVWARLRPRLAGKAGPGPLRATPIAVLPRRDARIWASLNQAEMPEPGARARAVLERIRAEGASFFDDLQEGSGLLRVQVEEALAELVGLGLVHSDGFAGLRALLAPAGERRPAGRARRGRGGFGMEDGGRWTLVRRDPGEPQEAAIEHVARALLRRYGVVFWRLLEREAPRLPPWRDLLRVFRRLEARGEIRGGRFVAGFSGEQYALPEAVGALREVRRKPAGGDWIAVSGVDPLNLAGIVAAGTKLPALAGNRLLYRDGVPVAMLVGGEVAFLEALSEAEQWQVRKALLRGAAPVILSPAAE